MKTRRFRHRAIVDKLGQPALTFRGVVQIESSILAQSPIHQHLIQWVAWTSTPWPHDPLNHAKGFEAPRHLPRPRPPSTDSASTSNRAYYPHPSTGCDRPLRARPVELVRFERVKIVFDKEKAPAAVAA